MPELNEQIKTLIQTYILTYNDLITSIENGETVISVSGGFSGSGQQFFTTQSESECESILENSIKTNANGIYQYVGAYIDTVSRLIPTYIQIVDSVEQAMDVARQNNATVFGIQDGGQLFINTTPVKVALAKAKMGGTTTCSSDLGCSWVNQVYASKEGEYAGGVYNDGTCALYTKGTLTSGDDSIVVNIEIYYNEKLNNILEEIQTLLGERGLGVYKPKPYEIKGYDLDDFSYSKKSIINFRSPICLGDIVYV